MPRTGFYGSVSSPKIDVAIDMGNPFLNRTVDGFLKIGAVILLSSSLIYLINIELAEISKVGASKVAVEEIYHILDKGTISKDSTQKSLKKMCTEGAYWGTVAGVYVGMEYGMERIRGTRDWKNAMLGGALTGVIISTATSKGQDRNKVVMDAITGGALATAAEFLNYLI